MDVKEVDAKNDISVVLVDVRGQSDGLKRCNLRRFITARGLALERRNVGAIDGGSTFGIGGGDRAVEY